MHSCSSQLNIYQKDSKTCGQCHPECKFSCSGPEPDNCLECVHVKDGKYCVTECPESKYARDGICVPCHETCVGCTGPNSTIGPYGCITCDKAIIKGDKIEQCLKKNDPCPGKHTQSLKWTYLEYN